MNDNDKQIADILAKYGEPFASNVWRVQGNAIIYHKCLERIAAQAQITYEVPTVLRAERDEAVILVVGRMGERTEWSIGEALVNVNYRVSGKQSAYVYAMAEKRAKDRVILKLIQLHGLVYSEEEADEFKNGRPLSPEAAAPEDGGAEHRVAAELKRKIDKLRTIGAVTELMTREDTQRSLGDLPQALRDGVRDHAKARMVALGWTPRKEKAAREKAA